MEALDFVLGRGIKVDRFGTVLVLLTDDGAALGAGFLAVLLIGLFCGALMPDEEDESIHTRVKSMH